MCYTQAQHPQCKARIDTPEETMKTDIKTVYLDSNGNQHESKSAAAKANRLLEAAKLSNLNLEGAVEWAAAICDGEEVCATEEHSAAVIEFSRAVVAIFGKKDGKWWPPCRPA